MEDNDQPLRGSRAGAGSGENDVLLLGLTEKREREANWSGCIALLTNSCPCIICSALKYIWQGLAEKKEKSQMFDTKSI